MNTEDSLPEVKVQDRKAPSKESENGARYEPNILSTFMQNVRSLAKSQRQYQGQRIMCFTRMVTRQSLVCVTLLEDFYTLVADKKSKRQQKRRP